MSILASSLGADPHPVFMIKVIIFVPNINSIGIFIAMITFLLNKLPSPGEEHFEMRIIENYFGDHLAG